MKELPEHFKFKIQISFALVIAFYTPLAAQALDWVLDGAQIDELPSLASIFIELVFFMLGFFLMRKIYWYIISEEENINGRD